MDGTAGGKVVDLVKLSELQRNQLVKLVTN